MMAATPLRQGTLRGNLPQAEPGAPSRCASALDLVGTLAADCLSRQAKRFLPARGENKVIDKDYNNERSCTCGNRIDTDGFVPIAAGNNQRDEQETTGNKKPHEGERRWDTVTIDEAVTQ